MGAKISSKISDRISAPSVPCRISASVSIVKPLISTKSVVAENLPRRFPAPNCSRIKGGTRFLVLFLADFSVKGLSISVIRIVVVKALCILKDFKISDFKISDFKNFRFQEFQTSNLELLKFGICNLKLLKIRRKIRCNTFL